MAYRYRPAPRWLAFDGSKFVDLSRRVNGWDFSHGTDLHFSEAAFGIRPAQGFLRLDNSGGDFSPGNWQGPVPVVYGVGGVNVWTGFAQSVGALPTGARDEIRWPLNSGLWRKYRKPARFTQRDQTKANSTPNGVLLQMLTSLADDDNGVLRLSGRTPAAWLSDARQDPKDWFLRYVRSTGTLARLINDLAAASMCIPFEDRFGRIGLASLVDQNKDAAPNTGESQHVQAVGSFLGEVASLDLWGVQVAGLAGAPSTAFTLSQQFQIPAGVSGPFLATFEYPYPDGTVHVDWAKGATPPNVTYEIVSVEALPYTLGDSITVAFGGTSTQPFALEVVGTPVIDAARFTVSRRVHTQGASFSAATEFYEIEPWVNLDDSDSTLAPAGGVAQFFSAQRVNPTLRYAMWGDAANSVPQYNDLGSSLGTQLVPARVKGFRTGLGVNPPLIPLQFRHFDRDGVPMVDIECTGWVQEFTANPRTIPPTVPGVPTVIPPTPEQLNPVVNIAAVAGSVTEGSPAVFTITSTPSPPSPLVVRVNVTATGDHVDDDELGVRTVTVPLSGAVNLSIPTLADTADEPDGTVSVQVLADPDLYRLAGFVTAATVRVSDDDNPLPVVNIIPKAASVVEGSAAVFTVTASPAPTAPLVVSLTVSQTGSYVPSGSLGAKTVTVPISGTAEYSVPTVGDSTDAPDGTVSVRVVANAALYALASLFTAATVTVRDDDEPTPAPTVPRVITTLTNVDGEGICFSTAAEGLRLLHVTGHLSNRSVRMRTLTLAGALGAGVTTTGFDWSGDTPVGLAFSPTRNLYWTEQPTAAPPYPHGLRPFTAAGAYRSADAWVRAAPWRPMTGAASATHAWMIEANYPALQIRLVRRDLAAKSDTVLWSGTLGSRQSRLDFWLARYVVTVDGNPADSLVRMANDYALYDMNDAAQTPYGIVFVAPAAASLRGFDVFPTANADGKYAGVVRVRLSNNQYRIETFLFTPPSDSGAAVLEQSRDDGSLWHMAQEGV